MRQIKLFKVSEIELHYKSNIQPSERPKIKSSSDAYQVFLEMWSDKIEFVEEFNLLLLNRANHVIGFVNLSKGGVSGTVVDAKLVFATALKANASGIIIGHNHPSGNTKASKADLALTQKLKKGAAFLDLNLLDHLIITPHTYTSLADEGSQCMAEEKEEINFFNH